MDILDYCSWKKCKQSSTILWYGTVGLCDKHTEEWLSKEEAFGEKAKTSKLLLEKFCSPHVKKYYKENPLSSD